jgi:hypothetical protein
MGQCHMDVVACGMQAGMQSVLTGWTALPGPVAWAINGVVIVLALLSLAWSVRWVKAEWRRGLKRVEYLHAWERKEKLMDYQATALIRESEEWCVDTSELKTYWDGHKQVRRWFLQSQTYQALAMYPLLLLTVVGMVSLPFHSLLSNQAFGMGMAIFAALALTWCVWCTIASLHLYGRVRRKLHLSSL